MAGEINKILRGGYNHLCKLPSTKKRSKKKKLLNDNELEKTTERLVKKVRNPMRSTTESYLDILVVSLIFSSLYRQN